VRLSGTHLIVAVVAAVVADAIGGVVYATPGGAMSTGCALASHLTPRSIDASLVDPTMLTGCASIDKQARRSEIVPTAPAMAHRRHHRKPRFVAELVRRSFMRELRRQARIARDVVHVRSFTCATAYTTGKATYFTCHARVSIKARGERWSALGDDVDYWLLVVETRRWLGWRVERPDVCDRGSYAPCMGFAVARRLGTAGGRDWHGLLAHYHGARERTESARWGGA
jgi:hypothetical protein